MLAGLCAMAAVIGCVPGGGEPWSTRSRSVTATGDATPSVKAADAMRDEAVTLVLRLGEDPSPLLRVKALEALHDAPEHVDALARRGLADENRAVRFGASMTVGQLRLAHLAHLLEPLLADESESVRAAAIFGLTRCGEPVDPTPLAAMIRSDDPEIRANAALVLGELGNPTAIPMIHDAVGRGMTRVPEPRVRIVNLQLAEAMVKLGADEELEAIRAALFAPVEQAELTALACTMCGRLGDRRAVPNLEQLARREQPRRAPAEVRMAATWALARLDPARALAAIPMEYATSRHFQLRMQAAVTLGELGDPGTLEALAGMMTDPNPLVALAAAGAILRMTRVS